MASEKITAAVITMVAAAAIGAVVYVSYKSLFSVGNREDTPSASSINGPKLKLLSWKEPDERSSAYRAYAELLGAAEGEELFEYTNTSYRDRYARLEQMIKSGSSPDIFPFELSSYPISVSNGYFTALDAFISFDDPIWNETRDINEQLKWNGHYYCAAVKSRPSGVLWYRESVIKQYRLDDPYELYKNGEWTTKRFEQLMSEFTACSTETPFYGIDGYETAPLLTASCGTPLVSSGEGGVVSNVESDSISRISDSLLSIYKSGLVYPYAALNRGTPSYKSWADGTTLFFADAIDRYEKTWASYRDVREWSDSEICLVPFPRDEGADACYYSAEPVGYMLCAGSENVYDYRRFVECAVTALKNVTAEEQHTELLQKNIGITQVLLDRIHTIGVTEKPIVDFYRGVVSPETTMGISGQINPFCELINGVLYYGEKHDALCKNYEIQLQSALDTVNGILD